MTAPYTVNFESDDESVAIHVFVDERVEGEFIDGEEFLRDVLAGFEDTFGKSWDHDIEMSTSHDFPLVVFSMPGGIGDLVSIIGLHGSYDSVFRGFVEEAVEKAHAEAMERRREVIRAGVRPKMVDTIVRAIITGSLAQMDDSFYRSFADEAAGSASYFGEVSSPLHDEIAAGVVAEMMQDPVAFVLGQLRAPQPESAATPAALSTAKIPDDWQTAKALDAIDVPGVANAEPEPNGPTTPEDLPYAVDGLLRELRAYMGVLEDGAAEAWKKRITNVLGDADAFEVPKGWRLTSHQPNRIESGDYVFVDVDPDDKGEGVGQCVGSERMSAEIRFEDGVVEHYAHSVCKVIERVEAEAPTPDDPPVAPESSTDVDPDPIPWGPVEIKAEEEPDPEPVFDETAFRAFAESRAGNAGNFLALIAARGEVTLSDAAKLLDVESRALGGITGGITRASGNANLLVPIDTIEIDGERAWRWTGPEMDLGWVDPTTEQGDEVGTTPPTIPESGDDEAEVEPNGPTVPEGKPVDERQTDITDFIEPGATANDPEFPIGDGVDSDPFVMDEEAVEAHIEDVANAEPSGDADTILSCDRLARLDLTDSEKAVVRILAGGEKTRDEVSAEMGTDATGHIRSLYVKFRKQYGGQYGAPLEFDHASGTMSINRAALGLD